MKRPVGKLRTLQTEVRLDGHKENSRCKEDRLRIKVQIYEQRSK